MVAKFLDILIVPYGISEFVRTDYGPQFVSEFFAMLRADLGVKHLGTTTYGLQTNG